MIDFTPSKALKPGMQVQVTETGNRAVVPSEDNPVWTVRYAFPSRTLDGRAGTEVEFHNGVTAVFRAGGNWIVLR